MAPVLAGMCSYESLINGAVDIRDVALMNDALAVRADNEMLRAEAQERSVPRGRK